MRFPQHHEAHMELLAIVKAVLIVSAIGAGTATFGPNEQPAAQERVAITGKDGAVLYYNLK